MRDVLKYTLIALSFVGLFHYNVVSPELPNRSRDPLSAIYYVVVKYDKLLGLAQTWRMYTPVPRHIVIVDWYAQASDGRWIPVAVPNYSAEHRKQRNSVACWLRDFKRARLLNDYLYGGDQRLAELFIKSERRRIAEQLEWEPAAIRVVVKQALIPDPSEKGAWTPYDATFRFQRKIEHRQ